MAIRWKLFFLCLIFSLANVNAQGSTDVLKCIICDSTNDKCESEPQSIASKDCATATAKECFTSVGNDGTIKRGCVEEDNKCDTSSCKNCIGPACNTIIPFVCKNCDSSKNANCSKLPEDNTLAYEICDTDIKKCLTQIKDDKHIERRCITKTDEKCPDGKKCTLCETTRCNKEIFPADRRRCYQCPSSSKCANPSTNTAEILSLPCTLYVETDKCYIYGKSDTDMTRGCVSDEADFTNCKENCFQCDTDNCNNVAYSRTQSLKCIQCNSDDANCAWGHADSEAKNCVNQIEYWKSEGCYTNKIDDTKVARGCLHDAPKELDCSAAANCTTCVSGDACNKADAMDYSCYKCRDSIYSDCAKALDGKGIQPEKCRNPVTQADQGCYTERWNDIIIRSCLVDADIKTRKNCLSDSYKLCDSCTKEANCNTAKAPSSAHGISLASGLLALTILVLRLF